MSDDAERDPLAGFDALPTRFTSEKPCCARIEFDMDGVRRTTWCSRERNHVGDCDGPKTYVPPPAGMAGGSGRKR